MFHTSSFCLDRCGTSVEGETHPVLYPMEISLLTINCVSTAEEQTT